MWFDNVQYDVHHVTDIAMFSVGIRYRGLRAGEHLDFSRWANDDLCGVFVTRAAIPSTSEYYQVPRMVTIES